MKDRAVCVDKTGSSEGQMSEVFETKFDVEHALVLYASNFVAMSAAAIYEDEAIRPHLAQIRDCHIYLIGLTPRSTLPTLGKRAMILLQLSTWLMHNMKYGAHFRLAQKLSATQGRGCMLRSTIGGFKRPMF